MPRERQSGSSDRPVPDCASVYYKIAPLCIDAVKVIRKESIVTARAAPAQTDHSTSLCGFPLHRADPEGGGP
jgi:hypothetical protein